MLKPFRYDIFIVAFFCLFFVACDVGDERDLCCDHVVMEYIYLTDGKELFKQNIRSMRHFLFDDSERFVREVPSEGNLQLQYLDDMEAGTYTMITVGNAGQSTLIETPEQGSHAEDFLLHIAGTKGENADPLYYGIKRFTLNMKSDSREQHFVTHMANVHCKLRIKVVWKNLPPLMSNEPCYRISLSGCATTYELDGKQGYPLGEKHIPYASDWTGEHHLDCALESLELKANFITLRCTNDNAPLLNVWCRKEEGYVPVTPEIDLKRAFAAWGYRLSTVERQEYGIIVTVYLDGHVGVKLEAEVGVQDWMDGGSFG
ncbi:FimB/Mfa2 family fimbrial subunit [Bacteroides sp. GD17]|jgi:hypothetical protein|uniref:FimB/Mfa2 family fimbrial subunit n=1 Tax=Bacteroides sp. GD17 TaxID=3139826 RepID=UPI0026001296|nr:FimB/Mfa2 family fimbrial subunit [uncultured Bacteroides sp.]